MKQSPQAVQEGIHLLGSLAGAFFNDSQTAETLQVHLFPFYIKLFISLLSRGVAGGIEYRPADTVQRHIGRIIAGIFLVGEGLLFQALRLQEAVTDIRERLHLGGFQFREEDFSATAQHAGQQANLSALPGAHKVTEHVVRSHQRLALFQTAQPALGQRTIREGHIGKARSSHFKAVLIGEDKVFHNALAGAHHVHRVGGLVRRDAEEVPGRELAKEVQQGAGLQVVVFQQGPYGIAVFFRANVLVGTEIGHNVKAFLFPEQEGEHGVREVQRIAAVVFRHLDVCRTPKVPG